MRIKLPTKIKTTAMARPKGTRAQDIGDHTEEVWTGKQLAQAVRATKGPIYGSITGINDSIDIQLVKSDLLAWALEQGDREVEYILLKKGKAYYFDKNYAAG